MKKSKLTIHKVDLSQDRFRKLSYKHAILDVHDQLYYVFVGDVRKLLVREHAAIERLVRRMPVDVVIDADTGVEDYWIKRTDLLAALKEQP